MARSPTDATRFTATGPYAASGSSFTANAATSSPGSQINFDTVVPQNETPQQKIARLRAAAAAAKRPKETQFDAVVRIGRRWADRAHRVTAIGLIGLTVITGMVATAGITDMMLHNRRRRNEWLAQKKAETAADLQVALVAQQEGRASDDQMLLINRERAAHEAAEAKKNRPGMFRRATNAVFGGGSTTQQQDSRMGAEAADTLAVSHVLKEEFPRTPMQFSQKQEEREIEQRLEEAVEDHRIAHDGLPKPHGGPLDQQAQRAVNAVATSGGSWMSWLTGSR